MKDTRLARVEELLYEEFTPRMAGIEKPVYKGLSLSTIEEIAALFRNSDPEIQRVLLNRLKLSNVLPSNIEPELLEGFQPSPSGVAFKLKEILATFEDSRSLLVDNCDMGKERLVVGIDQLKQAIQALENLNN